MKITRIDKPIKESKDFAKLLDEGDYFKTMDEAIRDSPTASMAVLMFKKYCTLPKLTPSVSLYWEKLKDEKIKYGYFTLWVEYNADLEVKAVHFRNSCDYRAKIKDDLGRVSQYLNVRTGKIFPAFNKDKDVLRAQIEEAGGFDNFTGQIYQYNTTSQPYELSVFVPVYKWLLVESDTPIHITASADNALFGNNIFIMRKGAESSAGEDVDKPKQSNTDAVIGALRQAKTVKNSGTNHVLTVNTEEPLDQVFHKVEIGNNIDLDKFNAVDDKAGKKICTAAYCFPQILANPSEGLFGNSGEAYEAAIRFWQQTCEFEALKIEKAFQEIGVEIQEVVESTEELEDQATGPSKETLAAQAALRGSVGGVQALLSIQTSYSQELTTRESAIAMIELIFGFPTQEAERLLGAPIIESNPTQ
jgi:hypothetical protein